MYVELCFYELHIHALVDTGASRTVLRRHEFEILCKLTGRTPVLKKSVALCGVTGHDITVLGHTEMEEKRLGVLPVIIVEGISQALIIGRDVLRSGNACINYHSGCMELRGVSLNLLPCKEPLEVDSLGERPPVMRNDRIQQFIEANEHLFAAKGEALGCHPDISVKIETTGPPIKRRPYRLPLVKRAALDLKIDELLTQGVIVPSSSPWASPVVLVEKKDPSEGPRFCIDFTKLNKVTKKDAYPIPLIRDIFDQLQGAAIFSTLDLKAGFHQLPVDEADQEKTAFVCHRGLFQWTRLPMGLCNASQLFQRAMEIVLKGLIGTVCMIYIDDIVVYSKNEEDHVDHLSLLFERLQQFNLRLNPAKCVFGMKEVKLLGYIVSEHGLAADPAKVAAISRMDAPRSLAEVRSFLGMSGYYRTCIRDYARVTEPLVELTRKNVRFRWEDRHQEAFNTLKQALVSEQVMAHPRVDKPYLLYTDACDYAVGGILCQTDDDGIERPIVYLSKQLSATQRRWATIEKEAYGVVYALKQLRPYLWGAKFRTFTDHKPLTSLFTKDLNNTKIQRWAVLLSEYNCRVEYHKGKLNIRADMLSRIRQREHISTFDVDHWHLGEELPELPPDDQQPDVYGLDLKALAIQQRDMSEWTEHYDDESAFQVINGLLYSINRPHKYAPDYPRLVLSHQQRPSVMERAHQEVGHMAFLKTLRKIQEAFVWPGMLKDVKRFVSRCTICIAHSKKIVKAPMGEMPIATAPMQIIGMDLIGPLTKTPTGSQYILTLIDHCTGWAEAFPLPQKTSKDVWKRLSREFFPRHGYPDIIINDQGLEFSAKSLQDYLRDVGIEQRRTTSYNPQSNGKCERLNGTLKQILSRLINNSRDSWEDQLGPALMAYNNAISSVTGHTPYFLHYGRRSRLPINRLLRQDTHMDTRLQDITDALRTATELTAASRHHNRQRLEQQANAGAVCVGDAVVIKAQEPLSLTTRWDPEWTVTKVKSKVVWITNQQTGKQKTLNVNKVRVVDPNLAWDRVNPRPIRNPRQGPRIAIRQLPGPRPTDHQSPQHDPQSDGESIVVAPQSRKQRVSPAHKRHRSPSTSSDEGQALSPSTSAPRRSTIRLKRSADSGARHSGPATVEPPAPTTDHNTSDHQADQPPLPSRPSTSAKCAEDPGTVCPQGTAINPDAATYIPPAHWTLPPTPRTNHHGHSRPAPYRIYSRTFADEQPTDPPVFITPLPPASSRAPAHYRPPPERRDSPKRLRRQAQRRPHQPEFVPSSKRSRPYLPRGTKRQTLVPTQQVQKKARADIITLVASWPY